MMRGLPMEIVGPVLGIGTLISIIVAGVIAVRVVPARLAPRLKSPELDPERLQALDEVQSRLGELDHLNQRIAELEERVDFTERLLAQRHDEKRLGP